MAKRIKITGFLAVTAACVVTFQNCGRFEPNSEQSLRNDLHQLEIASQKQADGEFDVTMPQTLAKAAAASCLASDLNLTWPMPGAQGAQWTINNFMDLDPTEGLRDYAKKTGTSAKTYNGHLGIDIDAPNFRWMDNGYPVVAAASGVVTGVRENQYDRNLDCASTAWNAVEITHKNGFKTWYGHLRKASVSVEIGQSVAAGQQVGVLGSSGCSTHPHLHLEVKNCAGTSVDPMQLKMFKTPPAYNSPLSLMDVALKLGTFTSQRSLLDPPNKSIKSALAGQTVSLALYVAGAKKGDSYVIKFYRPDGGLGFSRTIQPAAAYDNSQWYQSFKLDLKGIWSIKTYLNGRLSKTTALKML